MYYPLSQITPNLYTNGGELVISSTLENYIGYYYETSTGEKYVGKIPQGNSSILLIPPPLTATEEETYSEKYVRVFSFPDDADPSIGGINEFVNQLTTIKYSYVSPQESPKIRKIPTSIKPYYTQEDLDRGEYKRYFAKKTNEFIYMEISLEDYKKLKSEDPTIAFDLYNCVEMWWDIIDPSSPDFLDSSNNESYFRNIEIIEKNNNWFGFGSYMYSVPFPIIKPSTQKTTTSGVSNTSTPSSTSTSGGGY